MADLEKKIRWFRDNANVALFGGPGSKPMQGLANLIPSSETIMAKAPAKSSSKPAPSKGTEKAAPAPYKPGKGSKPC